MASNIWLISGGTNYYISGGSASQTPYSGSGTPWTAQTTTPYEIAMNDTAGTTWTPIAAQRQEVYGGGPPFRDGQSLIYNSYGNSVDTVTIQCRATTHNNAVFLLRQLRQVLNTALYSTPCILAVQPDGATNVVYFEIYGADVQEDARFINEEAGVVAAGQALLRAVVTWRRSPHGGLLSTGETLINAVSIRNTGTGSPDNVEAYSTGTGEMIYEGGPLNIRFTPTTASSNPTTIHLASVASRSHDSSLAGTSSTTSTTFGFLDSTSASIAALFAARGLRMRVIGRFSAMSTNAEVRLFYGVGEAPAQYTRGVIPNSSVAQLVDFGAMTPTSRYLPSVTTTDSCFLEIQVRSTTGGAVSVTIDAIDILFYYDFCTIKLLSGAMNVAVNEYLYLDNVVIRTGHPVLPRHPAQAWIFTSSNTVAELCELRGTPPKYYSGSSLYAAWNSPSVAHATTQAATISVFHAPLYKTLRGAG